ncbi:SCO6745 family protein [Nocardioides cheoyonin]|uniref:SCO6745 family protein n=1 Tax=Nocardioides cheoyonin TaxID=3156615 RepID=UPI0032B523E1
MTDPTAGATGPSTPAERERDLWRLLEVYHSVVYFAQERTVHYPALGLKGGWMGYFATRSAALGRVPPEVVTACFYNFNHPMVARALPDAWLYTTPEKAYAARLRVIDDAMRRLLGGLDEPWLVEAADLAMELARVVDTAGRPLAAAHTALPVPEDPHLRLFWASAVLREYRGDGHTIALTAAGIDGCEAHVLMAALGLVPADQRVYRGWSEEDWDAATRRLAERGWVTDDGGITEAGGRVRRDVELVTERLAHPPFARLGEGPTSRLAALLTEPVARIVTSGEIVFPNGIGQPPVPELSTVR